ncbi:hypothetical protein AVEN_157349-1 [Araneus ventricosus]|uniref:Uncharacterized protein n=1 Tax=Araneus ventricosus TaxID=182803 RepID=A0A4Y2S170_ARAVE|nr:hypothetical protein AVEN_69704-1 [Araneus ventricosus]GBN81922.1 hypothetical protein AVEN_157349-1 [Araneus ventricosus]
MKIAGGVTQGRATGCDTTSAIFRKEKSTAFKLIKENQELCSLISQLSIPQLDPQKVIEIGEVFLKHLFGGKQINSLDDLRYISYNKEVTKTLSSNLTCNTSTNNCVLFIFKSNSGWGITWILVNGDWS